MSSYEIKANVPKNRLYVMLRGFFSDADAKAAADKVVQEVAKLAPGFDVITDISDFKPTTPSGAAEVKRVQKLYVEKGVKHVVRIVGEQVLTKMQFTRTGKEVGLAAETATNLAEAERFLDSLPADSGVT